MLFDCVDPLKFKKVCVNFNFIYKKNCGTNLSQIKINVGPKCPLYF